MIEGLRQQVIVGNVTRDPELRVTPSGTQVTTVSVAVNHRRLNRETNTWEDAGADFYECEAWREFAQAVAQSIRKGQRVIAVGRIKPRAFVTKEGQPGLQLTMDLDDIGPSSRYAVTTATKVDTRHDDQQQGAQSQQAPQPQQGWQTPPLALVPQQQDWQAPPAQAQPQQAPAQAQQAPAAGWAADPSDFFG